MYLLSLKLTYSSKLQQILSKAANNYVVHARVIIKLFPFAKSFLHANVREKETEEREKKRGRERERQSKRRRRSKCAKLMQFGETRSAIMALQPAGSILRVRGGRGMQGVWAAGRDLLLKKLTCESQTRVGSLLRKVFS